MSQKNVLIQPSNIHLTNWEEIFLFLKGYAIAKQMRNTLIALSVATQFHAHQKRKGGAPYIIHPLEVTSYLINLGEDDDVTCAAAILHDVIEDCGIVSPYKDLGEKYNLDKEVIDIVLLVTKPKDYKETDPTEEKYYDRIKRNKKALIIKLSDRANNLSTIDAFTKPKMISYVDETKNRVYPLCKYGKAYYPELSNAITIIKYQMVSIVETIEAVYNLNPTPVDPLKYRKTLLFIRGFAKGRNMPNTLKALALAERLHEGQTRKSGDPFVIHPLRVASYLICLKFIDDYACAASLLHEVFKHCGFDRESSELVEKYGLDEEVLDLIRLVSKPDTMSLEDYYKGLKTNHKALIIKLSNRANTCTGLSGYTAKEKNAYIEENNNFIYPLCTYGKAYFPDYSDQIVNMKYHITSVCRIVKAITKEEVINEKK